MQIYEVILIDLNTKEDFCVQVRVDKPEASENIVISAVVKEHEITSSNYNYLPAFQEFRDELLVKGYGIKCNGSRLNAVQSGMMGPTDKVYLVESGKQVLMKDIAYIWDYAEIDSFPDTKHQKAFFEQWVNSLNLSLFD